MNKIAAGWAATRAFVGEVRAELKKCAWPPRSELVESTTVVIISVLILSLFVGVSDLALIKAMGLVIK